MRRGVKTETLARLTQTSPRALCQQGGCDSSLQEEGEEGGVSGCRGESKASVFSEVEGRLVRSGGAKEKSVRDQGVSLTQPA